MVHHLAPIAGPPGPRQRGCTSVRVRVTTPFVGESFVLMATTRMNRASVGAACASQHASPVGGAPPTPGPAGEHPVGGPFIDLARAVPRAGRLREGRTRPPSGHAPANSPGRNLRADCVTQLAVSLVSLPWQRRIAGRARRARRRNAVTRSDLRTRPWPMHHRHPREEALLRRRVVPLRDVAAFHEWIARENPAQRVVRAFIADLAVRVFSPEWGGRHRRAARPWQTGRRSPPTGSLGTCRT